MKMETRVLSWHQALEQGYQPGSYPFIATLVPYGRVTALLDFKVWARRGPAICLCFTEIKSDRKFQLAVYKPPTDRDYMIPGCKINFKTCRTGKVYELWIDRNSQGSAVLTSAVGEEQIVNS
jgi:hypothetical protein